MIRAMIVDDEPLAREKVSLFASSEPDLEVVATCSNGVEALSSFNTHTPDLIFLDIQMPELNGFDFLRQLKTDTMPGIIFITAYDEFALRAFEYHALDYLLKPFDKERFHRAVHHATVSMSTKEEKEKSHKQVVTLLESLKKDSSSLERLIVKTNGRVLFLKVNDIDWMEAAGNYIKLHVGNETHLIRETMNSLEQQLNGKIFVRVHRSTIINIDRIKELQPWFNGDYKITLTTNVQVIMSRGYRKHFSSIIGKPL